MMKLYDFSGAPNPRRVKIFAKEKNINLELVNCDMAKREHKTPEFLKKNPRYRFPGQSLNECFGKERELLVDRVETTTDKVVVYYKKSVKPCIK